MVTRALFQGVASTLKSTFGDFFIDRTFTQPGSVDPITGTETAETTETVPAVREEYNESQFDGEQIRVGDFRLLSLVADFSTLSPKVSGLKVNVDGDECQVIRAEKDAADAVWEMQVRKL